jgi:hypothetical protein
MNERIRQLVEQAQKEVWGNSPYNGSPEFEGYELDAEKFAELIVAECISTLDQDDGATHHGELLREHFGVESA